MLALPEAAQELKGDHATFTVRKKVFAYFLNSPHGDGMISVCAKVAPGDNQMLTNAQPERFYLPAYIGPRGWVALRLDAGKIDWDEGAGIGDGQLSADCAEKVGGNSAGGCMSAYVALLRGVNVGGKNKLPMKDLAAIFTRAECGGVQTYIQSGNVIFYGAGERSRRRRGGRHQGN